MPQMAPMWWTSLMLMFNLTLLMMMTKLYFNKSLKIVKKISIDKPKLNWKW